jgi:hypothetical protein
MHDVHVSDFGPYAPMEKGGEVVKVVGEQFVVLWFAFDTNYVNEAYTKLQAKCPDGRITSISSQLYTELGFMSWTNKLLLQGVCRANDMANTEMGEDTSVVARRQH